MKLTIKYFGMIEEAVGKAEELIEFSNSLSVDDIKLKLENEYPLIANKKYQIAFNQTIVNSNQTISDDCEIALLPPFAGG